MAALGSQSGISKSQLSRSGQEIDQLVQAFLHRPLESNAYAHVDIECGSDRELARAWSC